MTTTLAATTQAATVPLSLPDAGGATAAAALVVAGVFMWRGVLPRITALLMLVAGAGLASGWVQHAVTSVVSHISGWIGGITSAAFGASIPWLIAFVLAVYLTVELFPTQRLIQNIPATAKRFFSGGITTRTPPTKVGAAVVAFVFPMLGGAIPGETGTAVATVCNAVAAPLSGLLQSAFGIA